MYQQYSYKFDADHPLHFRDMMLFVRACSNYYIGEITFERCFYAHGRSLRILRIRIRTTLGGTMRASEQLNAKTACAPSVFDVTFESLFAKSTETAIQLAGNSNQCPQQRAPWTHSCWFWAIDTFGSSSLLYSGSSFWQLKCGQHRTKVNSFISAKALILQFDFSKHTAPNMPVFSSYLQ